MVFGFFESHWDSKDIPDQTGRVVLVTGGNTGIGYNTCLELARHGAKVYMLSRTESRARAAIERIQDEVPSAQVEFIPFDLCSLKSCKKAAEGFLTKEDRLDAVICNAGIMATPWKLSDDGIELQAHNGVGHFALIVPLLPILRKTAQEPNSHVRIVQVSSLGHNFARNPDFSSLEGLNRECSSTWERYGNSKLSNILLANELQKRLEGTGIYSLSLHPGTVNTELNRGTLQSYPFLKPVLNLLTYVLMTPHDGALTQLYAATSPEVEEKDLKAGYLVPIAKVGSKSALAKDPEGKLGAQFWSLCEKLVAEKS